MFKVYPLFSSSSGNMYLMKSNNSNILVDIGVTYKKVKESLCAVNLKPSDIDVICITHEHTDHIKGLVTFVKDNPSVPIYASEGTLKYLTSLFEEKKVSFSPNLISILPYEKYIINDIELSSFKTLHDAIDPVGYKISCGEKCVTIATDLGMMTESVFSNLRDSDFSIIESNYDKGMLLAGKYPFELKRRIQGNYGHLSNDDSGQVIVELAKEGKRNFLLGHLSENNNMPCVAKENIISSLTIAGFNVDDFNINLASKDFSAEAYLL